MRYRLVVRLTPADVGVATAEPVVGPGVAPENPGPRDQGDQSPQPQG